jgi:hypothetical protein
MERVVVDETGVEGGRVIHLNSRRALTQASDNHTVTLIVNSHSKDSKETAPLGKHPPPSATLQG